MGGRSAATLSVARRPRFAPPEAPLRRFFNLRADPKVETRQPVTQDTAPPADYLAGHV